MLARVRPRMGIAVVMLLIRIVNVFVFVPLVRMGMRMAVLYPVIVVMMAMTGLRVVIMFVIMLVRVIMAVGMRV
jgi:hypothetical protein